jgi:hypothetical protein
LPALDILKAFDLDAATVSLWVFKKSAGSGGSSSFKGRWVETTDDLDNALKAAVSDERNRIEEVQEYSLLAQNNEASVLSLTAAETHAGLALSQTAGETAQKKVKSFKDIQNTNFYAIKLVFKNTVIFAIRKADSSWRAKQARTAISVFFADNQLGLDLDPGFNISKSIDFFVVGDDILISNKSHFESILNYKQAHKDDFTALQSEPEFAAVFSSMEILVAHIGENKIHLRRASAIHQKGHYKNNNFMQNLRDRHAQFGLHLQFDEHGKIVPSMETCQDIMQALLDHRLTSAFSNNVYDVPDATNVAV